MAGWRAFSGRTLMVMVLAAGALPVAAASRRQPPPPPPPPKGPVEYLKSLLPWTEVGPAPDFVRESRPAVEAPFMPVGTDPGDQELPAKSAAELANTKAEMEQARAVHDNLRAHPPALTVPAAGPPAPAAAPPAAPAAKSEPAKSEPGKAELGKSTSAKAKPGAKKRSARHKPAPAAAAID